MRHLADEGRALGVVGVCVDGAWTPLVRERLEGSPVRTVVVVGFPHGAMATPAKAFEAWQAVHDGADELDMVMSLGRAKAGEWDAVRDDIAAVVEAGAGTPVKVILETILLEPIEIVEACLVAVEAGAEFVKTSTGFYPAGGTREAAVRLMRRAVGDDFGVKASGGVRSAEAAIRMLAAGANRIGTSSAGATLGIALGLGAAFLASMLMRHFAKATIHAAFSWPSVLTAAAISVGIGLAFGMYPALRAARLSPVDAMRTE